MQDRALKLIQNRTFQLVTGTILLIIIGAFLLRFELPVVSVSAEHIPDFNLGPIAVSNSLLSSWIVSLFIIIVAILGTFRMKLVPSGLQNIIEIIVETSYNLTELVSGPKWAPRFFVIPTTIFIYVLFSNWFGLIPGLAGIGVCHEPAPSGHVAEEAEAAGEQAERGFRLGSTCAEGEEIIPFFRSPSADLNNTLMLAIVTQVVAQIFGVTALGFGGYFSKFFVISGIKAAFEPDEHGNPRERSSMLGQLALGTVEFFVGLLEGLSEFIKIIAFTFRLFGNIFAGEVMLVVLTFLVPLVLTIPFLGFEIFVGAVQAFIFFILSIAFYNVAVTSHSHEEGH